MNTFDKIVYFDLAFIKHKLNQCQKNLLMLAVYQSLGTLLCLLRELLDPNWSNWRGISSKTRCALVSIMIRAVGILQLTRKEVEVKERSRYSSDHSSFSRCSSAAVRSYKSCFQIMTIYARALLMINSHKLHTLFLKILGFQGFCTHPAVSNQKVGITFWQFSGSDWSLVAIEQPSEEDSRLFLQAVKLRLLSFTWVVIYLITDANFNKPTLLIEMCTQWKYNYID